MTSTMAASPCAEARTHPNILSNPRNSSRKVIQMSNLLSLEPSGQHTILLAHVWPCMAEQLQTCPVQVHAGSGTLKEKTPLTPPSDAWFGSPTL